MNRGDRVSCIHIRQCEQTFHGFPADAAALAIDSEFFVPSAHRDDEHRAVAGDHVAAGLSGIRRDRRPERPDFARARGAADRRTRRLAGRLQQRNN